MEITKDTVQAWLDSIGKDRHWLAEQIGSTYLTINQYMSKGFPKWAKQQLDRLMNPPQAKAGIELSFTDAEFDLILTAMGHAGYTSRPAFYHDAICQRAEQIISDEQHPNVHPFPGSDSEDLDTKIAEDASPWDGPPWPDEKAKNA